MSTDDNQDLPISEQLAARVDKIIEESGVTAKRNKNRGNIEPFSRLRAYMEHVAEMARSLGIDAVRQFMAMNPYRSRGKQRSKPFCRTILARHVPGKVYPRQSKRECERRVRQGVAA